MSSSPTFSVFLMASHYFRNAIDVAFICNLGKVGLNTWLISVQFTVHPGGGGDDGGGGGDDDDCSISAEQFSIFV